MTPLEYIIEEKISISELGRRCGVKNRNTIRRYVLGERNWPPELLVRMLAETGGKVTPNDIYLRSPFSEKRQGRAA